jgi:hypothetical protein
MRDAPGQATRSSAILRAALADASVRGVAVTELQDRLVMQGAILSLADPAAV